MKTDFLESADFFLSESKSYELECVKMNTSNSDSDQNTSLINGDSGYLTNYAQESQIYSSSSSSTSTNLSEDFYPQKPILNEISVQNNVYFCENAVFDEPKLEGPPILLEDISVDINHLLQPTTEDFGVNFGEKPTIILELPSKNENSAPPNQLNPLFQPRPQYHQKTDPESSNSNSGLYFLQNHHCESIDLNSVTSTLQYVPHEKCSTSVKTPFTNSYDSERSPKEPFVIPSVANIPRLTPSRLVLDAASSAAPFKSDIGLRSLEKRLDTPERIFNASDSETSFSSQTNDPFEALKVNEVSNSTISSVASGSLENLVNVTPKKPIIPKNEISPDLFSEEEPEEEVEYEILPVKKIVVDLDTIQRVQKPVEHNEQYLRNDRKLLRRVQESLSGVPPPPSVTIIQTTVTDMLNKIYANKHLFLTENKTESSNERGRSLLICNTKEEIEDKEWPEIANHRYHGLHFNRTKVSEDFEFFCMKYQNRYVGVDTASSCTVWSTNVPSSAKKRNARLRWTAKSPGRRLSHLAKRRITFSSSNLQANCSAAALSVIGSTNSTSKQLIIDTRKSKNRKSPWKKSPLKKVRTPNSSSKKLLRRLNDEPQPGPSRMVSTKRALFQSPEHNRSTTSTSSLKPRNLFFTNSPNKSSPLKSQPPFRNSPSKSKNSPFKLAKDSPTKSASKSRRNLFSSPLKDKKRKRNDEPELPNKIPKSLSFDIDRKKEHTLQRCNSELSINKSKTELSDLHKKKLLWAVSEALRAQSIGMSNPKFKQYAPILCKIVKSQMPDLVSGARLPGSTSDRMLKIARQHVFSVTRGKTFEEIISELKKNEPPKTFKPTGYVPPESFKNDTSKILQDKVLNIEVNTKPNEKARVKRILFDDDTKCNTNR